MYRLREELDQADRYRSLASRNATSLTGRLFGFGFGFGGGGGGASSSSSSGMCGGGDGSRGALGRLKSVLVDELDRIAKAREEALGKLEELRRRVAGKEESASGPSPSSFSSPSPPDPALVAAAGGCGRCRGSDLGARGAVCDHCRLDESFLAWELSLFALTTRAVAGGGARARGGGISAEDALRAAQAAQNARVGRGGLGEEGGDGDGGSGSGLSSLRRADGVSAAEVVRHPSEAEKALRVLRTEVARVRRPREGNVEDDGDGGGDGDGEEGQQQEGPAARKKKKKSATALAAEARAAAAAAAAAEASAALARVGSHALDVLAALRDKLFLKSRALALAQRALLYAVDELDMATTTLQLSSAGGGGGAAVAGGGGASSSRVGGASRSHEALYTLAPHELPHRAAELEAEAAAAEADLRRALGTLRYLTSLAGDGGRQEEEGGCNGGGGGGGGETAAVATTTAASPDAAASSPPSAPLRSNNPSAPPRVGMCPVCHDDFGKGEGEDGAAAGGGSEKAAAKQKKKKEIAMPPCAHALCFGCFRALASRSQQRAFSCPTCRASTLPSDVRRVVLGGGEAKEREEEAEKEKEELKKDEESGKGKAAAAAAAPAGAAAAAPQPPSSSFSVIPPDEASVPVYGDYGTKVEAVVRRIKAILAAEDEEDAEAERQRLRNDNNGGGNDGASNTPTTTKVLVFSTWVEALEIVAHALATNGVRAVLAKGRAELGRTVAAFRKNGSSSAASAAAVPPPRSASAASSSSSSSLPPRVLLLPAKQGAAGLNLTEAQHVVFLEPWLDPAAEAQAVGRVHRIGQSKATVSLSFFPSSFRLS